MEKYRDIYSGVMQMSKHLITYDPPLKAIFKDTSEFPWTYHSVLILKETPRRFIMRWADNMHSKFVTGEDYFAEKNEIYFETSVSVMRLKKLKLFR